MKIRKGHYIKLDGLTKEQHTTACRAFIAAGARPYEDENYYNRQHWGYLGWDVDGDLTHYSAPIRYGRYNTKEITYQQLVGYDKALSTFTVQGQDMTASQQINNLCNTAHYIAKEKGWWDNPPEFGTLIALMHSELSEALEAKRNNVEFDKHLPELPAVGVELADVCIRIFDYCGANDIDLGKCIVEKIAYNNSRPHKHGGKEF